jgi:hypothetical protein
LIATTMGRKTGKERISIKVESTISRGRFRKGSLDLDSDIECDFTADNYSTHKHEKRKSQFRKKVRNSNN